MIKPANKFRFYLALIGMFSTLLMLNSCDTLEQDANPNGSNVSVKNKEVYGVYNRPTYIDLGARVQATRPIRLDVSSSSEKGNLSTVGSGLLKYTPNNTFKSGKDFFTFSIYDNSDKLLLSDSIIITVGDSTDIPCGLYPKDDWIYAAGSPVDVDVLSNDLLCGNTSELILEIYKPGENSPPFLGSASVVAGNLIRYTAINQDITTVDTVIYRIRKASNSNVVGFGALYLTTGPYQCAPLSYTWFSLRTNHNGPAIDTAYYPLMDLSEPKCGVSYDSFIITKDPDNDKASFFYGPQKTYWLKYPYELTDYNQILADTIEYKICNQDSCISSKFFFEIKNY